MFCPKFLITLLSAGLLLSTSCTKDDPKITNQDELITTLKYTLEPSSGGASTLLTFEDIDGPGGAAATITGGTLKANETYSGQLELTDESSVPAEDITLEIQNESDDHQFFFQSTLPDVTVSYLDADSNSRPLGIKTTLSTGDAGTGTLTIILRHEPNKSADGVADGDITNAGGETDIEVTFPIDVE